MATAYRGRSSVVDALSLGQIERASLLLSEGSPLDLQRAAEVVIDKGQYEALKFLLSNYKLDVNKHFLLHRALVAQQENIAKLLVELGADVNNCHSRFYEVGCAHYSCYLPLQLSLFCSLDMTRFLLDFGADVNKRNNSLESTLVFACRMSVGADRVVFLLENEANVHAEYRHDVTALHWAARLGDTEKLTLFIDHGADIEAGDGYDCTPCTPLQWACSSSESVDCLKILLEKGADCGPKNLETIETALHLAAKSGNFLALKLLIQYGAKLEARTLTGDTALILACGESVTPECVRILLENGAFPNVKNRDRKTPLNLAKETRNEEKIQTLLRYGATEEHKIDQEETDLMRTCGQNGNVRSVLSLLQNNASPNVRNHRRETALHMAAGTGDVETLKALLQCKADVNAMTNDDNTPLMLACANSSVNVECVKLLLENKALPNVTDVTGDTALSMAIRSKDMEKVKILVQYGADVNVRDRNNEILLILACALNVEYVKFLLENKALPNVTDPYGRTALHIALQVGDIEKVKILIQHGADVNARGKIEMTPLMLACAKRSRNVECVKFLLKNKALPSGDTALYAALVLGDTEKVNILVQYADVNAGDRKGHTPLMLVCTESLRNVDCVKFLLENKALPNLTDHGGQTALHLLMLPIVDDLKWESAFSLIECYVRVKTIKLLVEHGADLEVKTLSGKTPFLVAAQTGNHQIIELLHDLGGDVCAEDGEGRNAIMLAIQAARRNLTTCDLRLLQSLMDKGVPVNHRDKNGWTPLMLLAKDDGNVENMKCLTEAGADVHAVGIEFTMACRQESAALSLIIDRGPRLDEIAYLKKLITLGAVNSLPERCNGYLHRMIFCNQTELFHLLITNGMAPTVVTNFKTAFDEFFRPLSPLAVAITEENNSVIQYIVDNWMLCPCDLDSLPYYTEWRWELSSWDVVIMMDEFYSQPKSLFQLSFITVSHALGGVPGRVDRVNSLPLPSKIKDKLLFKSIDDTMVPW